MIINLALIGYTIAGIAFLVLTILLLTLWRGRLGLGLRTATGLATLWGFGMAWASVSPGLTPYQNFLLEFVHDGGWLLFLSMLLSGGVSSGAGSGRNWLLRYGGVLLTGAILAVGTAMEAAGQAGWVRADAGGIVVFSSILTSLYALVGIEQIFRNARRSQRHGLKFICLGIGGIFAYDLFLYSNAILLGQISGIVWTMRGFVVAMCIPLIAVAIRRSESAPSGIFVSRQIVFYSATLVGAGIYLSLVGMLGYLIRLFGGTWGLAVQLVFFFAASLALFLLLLSDRARAKLRVLINKHFYENKYDYRDEWLRLIATVTDHEDGLPLKKRGIRAIAEIVEGRSGLLWLQSAEDDEYVCVSSWDVPLQETRFGEDHSLVKFLRTTGWVIDLREYDSDPGMYEPLDLTGVSFDLGPAQIIVPLIHDADLLGFVALTVPLASGILDYEDHDLLKTAGQQIAGYLAQEQATEQLAESRQFEAFNRLTAYIMHDLKNAMTQQALVVENAEKHKRNPDFVDDAIETIKGSVERMSRMVEQLQQRRVDYKPENVDVGRLVLELVAHCDDRTPVPKCRVSDETVRVSADRGRLYMALYHAVRNAQDATGADGRIDIEVSPDGADAVISITDTGKGMDETFIRERLFKPFDSTKGAQGMGIGAYQIRETIRRSGGHLSVESRTGEGTRLIVRLPRA